MEHVLNPSGSVPAALERELTLIADAIALVRAGGSPRVVVAGLTFADQLLPRATVMASDAGVRLVALWSTDEHLTDLAVERVTA